MRINFIAGTNKDYVAINTCIFTLKNGTEITVDRQETNYTINGKELAMTWSGCYLWAINGLNVFDGKPPKSECQDEESIRLLQSAVSARFELEDDADEDYYVGIAECSIS